MTNPLGSIDGERPATVRCDAVRNRARILEVARDVFGERGVDVPTAAIARAAGVGAATLYRHFPTREILLTSVFGEQIEHCIAILDDAVDDPDPWRGFTRSLEAVVAIEVTTPGLTRAITSQRESLAVYDDFRSRAIDGLSVLIERLHDSRQVRDDFGVDDILTVVVALRAVAASDRGIAALRASRFIDLITHGIRTN